MTQAELFALYRYLSDDTDTREPITSDAQLALLFAEAETEAAIRGRLIHESADPEICQIAVVAGTAAYTMHGSLYELSHVSFVDSGGARTAIDLVSSEAMDDRRPLTIPFDYANATTTAGTYTDWRDATGTPTRAIQRGLSLRLIPTPDAAGTLHLEGYRTPIGGSTADPEIGAIHHQHLAQWVLWRVFRKPYSGAFDEPRAQAALAEFERYFGARPDADLRASTRHDTPHHVQPHYA